MREEPIGLNCGAVYACKGSSAYSNPPLQTTIHNSASEVPPPPLPNPPIMKPYDRPRHRQTVSSSGVSSTQANNKADYSKSQTITWHHYSRSSGYAHCNISSPQTHLRPKQIASTSNIESSSADEPG